MIIKRVKKLYQDSGPFLFLVRIPSRFFKKVLDKVSTAYYSRVLGSFGGGTIEWGVKIENPKNVHIGNKIYICTGTKIISENSCAELRIGDDVQIGIGCHIDHTGNLTIGAHCHLSEQVVIYSHSHEHNPRSEPLPIPKKIGYNCWIGLRAVILESAEIIADKTIIASCAVVSKSITEPGLIVGGIPAKFIKKRDE